MKKLILFTAIIILPVPVVYSQDDSGTKLKKSFSMEGALCLTVDDNNVFYYNMGGAQIKFDFNRKAALSLTLLPSIAIEQIKFTDDYDKTKKRLNARPSLGIGPQFFYKKFILSFPFYYKPGSNIWYASAGIGYKIQFSKAK